ncbi:MAG: hypothetical protein JWQ71_4659 [Pedosphaera sp.]|nr:hypothetical protein [Pedosphaera sp.]
MVKMLQLSERARICHLQYASVPDKSIRRLLNLRCLLSVRFVLHDD